MVRGKKGFERIVWAFKNVLDHTVAWLFYDLNGKTDGPGPISSHHPKVQKAEPETLALEAARVPELPSELQEDDYGAATELLEWLSLATIGSLRIQSQDEIDPYLSRYRLSPGKEVVSNTTDHKMQDLVRFYWHGLIPSIFIKDIFLAAMKVAGPNWFGVSAIAFDGRAYCLLQNNQHTMTWEYQD